MTDMDVRVIYITNRWRSSPESTPRVAAVARAVAESLPRNSPTEARNSRTEPLVARFRSALLAWGRAANSVRTRIRLVPPESWGGHDDRDACGQRGR